MMPHDWGYGGWGIGMFLMLLFWTLIVAGLVLLFRWMQDRGRPPAAPPGGESALDIVRKRYARGEIGREELEQMKRDLKNGG